MATDKSSTPVREVAAASRGFDSSFLRDELEKHGLFAWETFATDLEIRTEKYEEWLGAHNSFYFMSILLLIKCSRVSYFVSADVKNGRSYAETETDSHRVDKSLPRRKLIDIRTRNPICCFSGCRAETYARKTCESHFFTNSLLSPRSTAFDSQNRFIFCAPELSSARVDGLSRGKESAFPSLRRRNNWKSSQSQFRALGFRVL